MCRIPGSLATILDTPGGYPLPHSVHTERLIVDSFSKTNTKCHPTSSLSIRSDGRVLCGHKNLTACTLAVLEAPDDGLRSAKVLLHSSQDRWQTNSIEYTDTRCRTPDSVPLGRVSTGTVVDDVEQSLVTLEAQGLSVFRAFVTTPGNKRWLLPLAQSDVDSLQPKHQCRFTDWKSKYVRFSPGHARW